MPSKEEMISRLNEYLDTPLSPDATDEEIKLAFVKVVKKLHPDAGGTKADISDLAEINALYDGYKNSL